MKNIGKGVSYRKALMQNLAKSLLTHKKIQTTRSRGKKLIEYMEKHHGMRVLLQSAGSRRGDNSPQVILEVAEAGKKQKSNKKQIKS